MPELPTTGNQTLPESSRETLGLTTFTPSGTFSWGTVYVTSEKALTVTADAGELPAGALLEFSGATDAFECTEIEGNALETPVEVGLLSLNNRYFSWEEGQATTLKFQPKYTDGSAETATLTVKDIQGEEVDSFTLSATYQASALLGKLGSYDVIGAWSPMNQAAGGLANGATPLTDFSGNSEPDVEAILSAGNNWLIYDSAPMGSDPFLANYVAPALGAEGSSNYLVIQSATSRTPVAGMIIHYTENTGINCEVWDEGGIKGAPTQSDDFCYFQDSANYRRVREGTSAKLFKSGLNQGQYVVSYWRLSAGTMYFYQGAVGSTYNNLWSSSNSYTFGGTLRGGLQLGYRTTDSNPRVRRYAVVTFGTDPGTAGFADIHSVIST